MLANWRSSKQNTHVEKVPYLALTLRPSCKNKLNTPMVLLQSY